MESKSETVLKDIGVSGKCRVSVGWNSDIVQKTGVNSGMLVSFPFLRKEITFRFLGVFFFFFSFLFSFFAIIVAKTTEMS